MVVYPLSGIEDLVVCWTARVVPVVAIAVILLLGAVSMAATQV